MPELSKHFSNCKAMFQIIRTFLKCPDIFQIFRTFSKCPDIFQTVHDMRVHTYRHTSDFALRLPAETTTKLRKGDAGRCRVGTLTERVPNAGRCRGVARGASRSARAGAARTGPVSARAVLPAAALMATDRLPKHRRAGRAEGCVRTARAIWKEASRTHAHT